MLAPDSSGQFHFDARSNRRSALRLPSAVCAFQASAACVDLDETGRSWRHAAATTLFASGHCDTLLVVGELSADSDWHDLRFDRLIAPEHDLSIEARLLNTLQDLMELPAVELGEALTVAAEHIAEALNCEKVDAFLFEEHKQTLRAIGTSATPLGRLQRAIGLDLLPLANGGSTVEVFRTGVSYLEGNALRDPNELRGVVAELGVRSSIAAAFEINGARRGVLSAVSTTPEFFQTRDLQFLEAVARWMGLLAHRVELAELARKVESDHARRAAADEIITVLAHDLRNHLNPLLSRLQLISLHVESGKAIQSREIETALRSVRRLSTLTNDLLALKRLDQGLFSLNLVPVDLAAVAAETAESLTTTTATVNVGGMDSLLVVADADRVRQALENIVVNAIKYSPSEHPVSINVHLDSNAAGLRGVLEVVDQGPGIDPEILPTMFERFTLGPNSKGLGLGLYIAQRIARVHQGELTAESKPGMGTKFRLSLPFETTTMSERGPTRLGDLNATPVA